MHDGALFVHVLLVRRAGRRLARGICALCLRHDGQTLQAFDGSISTEHGVDSLKVLTLRHYKDPVLWL